MGSTSRTPERLALVLGVAVAAAAGFAALPLGSAAGLAGEVAVARAVAEVRDRVRAEWEAIAARPEVLFEGDVRFHAWTAGERPPTVTTLGASDAPNDLLDALLEEVMRHAGDARWDEAFAACADAERFAATPSELARVRLRRVQLAVRAGRDEVARAAHAALERHLTGEESEGGVSPALLAAFALAPLLDEIERATLQRDLVARWASGSLSLPSDVGRLARRDDGRLEAFLPVALELVAERLAALAPEPPKVLAHDLELRRLALVEAILDDPFERGPDGQDDGLRVLPGPESGDVFCWYREGERCRGGFLRANDLVQALELRLARTTLADATLSIDLGPTPPERRVLGDREVLVPSALDFAISHRDPAALARAESGRLRSLRTGLVALALLSVLAGAAGSSAMRRGRELVERERRFVATVSHELRTPVTAIRLVAENLAAGRASSPERLERYGANLDRESRRLARLVEDVLDLSRIQRGEAPPLRPEVVAPGALADALEAAARFELREGDVALEVEAACDAPTVRVDSEALARAVANLARNVATHAEASRARLRVACAGGRLRIVFSDDGRGIGGIDPEAAFQPFARGADRVRGAGLGLAIVRGIARAHGGTARSGPGLDGSGFGVELDLPCVSPATP